MEQLLAMHQLTPVHADVDRSEAAVHAFEFSKPLLKLRRIPAS